VKPFLKTLACHKCETVRCGSNVLDKPVIDSVHEQVQKAKVRFLMVYYFHIYCKFPGNRIHFSIITFTAKDNFGLTLVLGRYYKTFRTR